MKSNPLPDRIAIIEFDSSHDECLLTQVNALKKHGCWVMLVTNNVVRKRNAYLHSVVDEWRLIDPKETGLTGAAIGDALIVRRLIRSMKTSKIDKVIFNTAQGGHVRNACLFSLFGKIEFVGIIHTTRKFHGSFTQKIISLKIKKYFVLAGFLKPLEQDQQSKKIESFYALDFPTRSPFSEQDNQVHISIIGGVEMRRKDLIGFISIVEQCDKSVHFHFLGKADPNHKDVIQLKESLAINRLMDTVTFYDSFVDFETVDLILRKSIAVLPLIHPETPSAGEYFRHQIPGAMSIALGYQTPLLLHEAYQDIEELNSASIYYKLESFSIALQELKSIGETVRRSIQNDEKFTSEYQYNTIIKFLFNDENS